MNRSLVAIGSVAALALAGCAQAEAGSSNALTSTEEKESYGIGSMIAQQLRGSVGDVDTEAFLAGFSEGFEGESRLSEGEIASLLDARIAREQEEQTAAAVELAERNEAQGSAFRADFAKADDVVTLPSGLLYKVIEQGEGEIAAAGTPVTVHYRGALVDGTEFGSTYGQEPARFTVDRVIPGWAEALQQMPAGSKWQIVVPPDLAYGTSGAGGVIEPGATLVFELELVEVG